MVGKSECSDKVVDHSTGKVTIIKKEERYPKSSEILMSHGILLNMVFGLLPTTLYGNRLKYYRCSVAQAYAFVFGICMIILSFIFVPINIQVAMIENPRHGRTDTAVLFLGELTHVIGFLFLVIRGYYVARKMPMVWSQTAKLLQMSVVDFHGKKYRGLKKLTRYSRYAVLTYSFFMIMNEYNVIAGELDKIMPNFFVYYHLQLMELTTFNFLSIEAGFFIWKLCSFSHVLVSVMAGFLIVSVTVALRAGNDHLLSIFEDDNNLLIKKRDTIKFLKKSESLGNHTEIELQNADEKMLKALNQVKEIHVVAGSVLESMSKIFGVSLIVEVLILIANVLVNIFYILVPLNPMGGGSDGGSSSSLHQYRHHQPYLPNVDLSSSDNETVLIYRRFFRNYVHTMEQGGGGGNDYYSFGGGEIASVGFDAIPGITSNSWYTLLIEAFIHSYFFYKLCCRSTEMMNEAKDVMQILKTVPYDKFSNKIQHKISLLKGDLASGCITLTAANYFQINKFVLTSVTSALTTYIIVLLQFNQQEQDQNNGVKNNQTLS